MKIRYIQTQSLQILEEEVNEFVKKFERLGFTFLFPGNVTVVVKDDKITYIQGIILK